MKHFLTLYLLLTGAIFANSQVTNTWNTHSNYNEADSKFFLSKLDSTNYSGSDLQIRLWFSNGWSRINKTSLLLLVNKNKIWEANYCTFSKKFHAPDSTLSVEQKQVLNLNLDSLYQELLKDDLLTIRSDSIGTFLDEKGNHRWGWTDGGPTVYLIEIITPLKKWSLRYPCPKYFYEQYKAEKFIAPLKIVTSLMSLLGLSPC